MPTKAWANAHREEINLKYRQKYAAMDKDARLKKLTATRASYQKLKKGIFDHYGRKCVCCGEKHAEFLSIDHINGGGRKHRDEVGRGRLFYKWLLDNKYPPDFRILCYNCNISLGIFGYCPHKN